ncbi:hypothetical protein, partial [Enterobacter hormaechei]
SDSKNTGAKKPAHPRWLVQVKRTKTHQQFSPINTSGILIVASGDSLRQHENAREWAAGQPGLSNLF